MNDKKKFYFYPVWLRMWHGLNAIGIVILIITGISMQSNAGSSAIGFNLVINLHNIAGIVVTLSYFIYLIGNLITDNSKFYKIKLKGFFSRPMKQAYYYAWGMFHGEPHPYPLSEKRKFNPLQKYAYIFIMYFAVPLVIITGVSLFFPEIIVEKIYVFSGISISAVLHSIMGFIISIFLIVHLYIASIGKSPLDNFRSIITGWHDAH